jgi:DNA-binding transcriptional LysR family regulator
MSEPLSLSTDQLAAFVELARQGSIRAAAGALLLTEQGVRNRLLALEERLGAELYRKARGVRRGTPLTVQGRRLLPKAMALLEQAESLRDLFGEPQEREVHVVASQYLIAYALIDAVRKFHKAQPSIRVRLSARTEKDLQEALMSDPDVDFGVAAPYEVSPDLAYFNLFSMDWSAILPLRHALLKRRRLSLAELAEAPLIVYERGSTGRAHVIEAFSRLGLSPRVEMEATNTDLVVRMVEAGLGAAIVPLHPSGAVTRGRKVGVRPIAEKIRPIDSGILQRRGEPSTKAARLFLEFVQGTHRAPRDGSLRGA